MNKIPKKFTELVRFDWFMKYMFWDKRNFDILEGFLSVLLKEDIVILESEGNFRRTKKKREELNGI